MIVLDTKYVTIITTNNAAATYLLKPINEKPTVGATIKTEAIIAPKQHGQGATTAKQVAVVVFLS